MPVHDAYDISDLPPALRARQARELRPADALGELPAGIAVAAVSSAPPQHEAKAVPLVAQCKPCARIRHRDCERKAGAGPCLCYQCWSRVIISKAEHALASPDARILAASLQECLILIAQRWARDRSREDAQPRPPVPCACGCGRMVEKTASTGTVKLYATKRCLKLMQMRRYRARIKAGTVGPMPPQLPAPKGYPNVQRWQLQQQDRQARSDASSSATSGQSQAPTSPRKSR